MKAAPSIKVYCALTSSGRPDLLIRAVKSVLDQSVQPEKIIIAYDKSCEFSHELSERLLCITNKTCELVILKSRNISGLAGTANSIIDYLIENKAINSLNAFVAFLDDDDYWSKDYLLHCKSALLENYDFTASRIRRLVKNRKPVDQSPPKTLHIEDFLAGGATIQLSNFIVRLSVLDAIGRFDENLITNHDRDICIRLAEGGYKYKAIYDTTIFHDTTHNYLRLSSRKNALKQKGIRLFHNKWAPAMKAHTLKYSLARSARLFDYQDDFDPAELLIGTICTTQKGLERFIRQFDAIELPNFKSRIIAFANFADASEYTFKAALGPVDIITIPKLAAPVSISHARNILHYRILQLCKNEECDPLVWLLDEDIRITQESISKLPHCWAVKFSKRYDVLVGPLIGESPNSALFGLRGELNDLQHNLNWLSRQAEEKFLSDLTYKNIEYARLNPEYYYDLDVKTHAELNSGNKAFWLEPDGDLQTVKEARDQLFCGLEKISEGGRFFRSIRKEQNSVIWQHAKPTLHKGPNCLILNIDALGIPHPKILFNDQSLRRSDMLWTLIISRHFGLKIVEADVPVLHLKRHNRQIEFGLEKNTAELVGSIVFNALEKCAQPVNIDRFFSSLQTIAQKRLSMVENHIEGIQNLLTTLVDLPDENISTYAQQIQGSIREFNAEWLHIIREKLSCRDYASYVLQQYTNHIMQRLVISKASNSIPTNHGRFILHTSECGWVKMLILGDPWRDENPLVRVHSSCTHSEIFGARDCDCDSQLQSAMEHLAHHGTGVIFYLDQEGRGHGLLKKLEIIALMDQNCLSTYEACDHLGIEYDKRDYQKVIQLMRDTGLQRYTLLSNNNAKIQSFSGEFEIKKKSVIGDFKDENYRYLDSKRKHSHEQIFVTARVLDALGFCHHVHAVKFYKVTDEYGFLSNFDRRAIFRDGLIWPTAEHAYQAYKFLDPALRENIRREENPNNAKALAYEYQQNVRHDWDDIKIPVMHSILKGKISQYPELKEKLLGTGRAELTEITETDLFWGRSASGQGHNYLGKTWMFLRQSYIGE